MTTPRTTAKEKHDLVRKLLLDEHLLAHINPLAEGVTLPARLMNNPTVTLKLSKLFPGRVELLTERIEAELLFSGEYFTCILPLDAVWGVTSSKGQNTFWPDAASVSLISKGTPPAEPPAPTQRLTAVPPAPAPNDTPDRTATSSDALPNDVTERNVPAKKSTRRPAAQPNAARGPQATPVPVPAAALATTESDLDESADTTPGDSPDPTTGADHSGPKPSSPSAGKQRPQLRRIK